MPPPLPPGRHHGCAVGLWAHGFFLRLPFSWLRNMSRLLDDLEVASGFKILPSF